MNIQFSKSEIIRAGEQLRTKLEWTPESADQIRRIFAVASAWRDSHETPMRSIRSQLAADCRKLSVHGIAAARLKRMMSIRKKLARVNENLARLQDLAGCRVVLPDTISVTRLFEFYRSETRHRVLRVNDYVSQPKEDGYRSKHIVLNYAEGDYSAEGQSRRVEVQIRTRLQHSWATAVESVGLFTRQEFKSGKGDENWRRLFYLMSCEFARSEDCPLPDNAPNKQDSISEIRSLNERLNAADMLQNLTIAVQYLETGHMSKDAPKYWQLTYDSNQRRVTIEGFYKVRKGTESYGRTEIESDRTNNSKNTVLVQVDEVQNLATAYPNYFGDVRLFRNNLLKICAGEDVAEYTLPPLHPLPRQSRPIPDDSWLRFPRRRQWS